MTAKIMVIDDEVSITEALDIILTAKGYDVVTTNSGVEALNMLVECNPNLILLDIMMVPLDGLTVIKRLREMNMAGRYPIIVMTAMLGITEELAQLKENFEIQEFFFKPLDDNRLGKIYVLLDDIEKLTQAKVDSVEDVSGYNQTQALYPMEATDNATS